MRRAAVAAAVGLAALLVGVAWWGVGRGAPELTRTAAGVGGREVRGSAGMGAAADAVAAPAVRAEAPDDAALREPLAEIATAPRRYEWSPFVLHVVAAEDAAPLTGVRVVRPGQSIEEFIQSISSVDPVFGALQQAEWRGDSPLRIVPREDEPLRVGRHEVSAPGRETVRLRIDLASGGERHVALRPAGELRATLVDAVPGIAAHWRLFEVGRHVERIERRIADARRDASPAAAARVAVLRETLDWLRVGEATAADFVALGVALAALEPDRDVVAEHAAPLQLDDLAAGRWRIACYVDALPAAPLVATGEAWIEVGETATVELAYAAPQLLEPVACHGVVEFAPAAPDGIATTFRPPERIVLMQSIPRGLGRLESTWHAELAPAQGRKEISFLAGRAWPGPLQVSSDDRLWHGETQVPTSGEELRLLLRPTPKSVADRGAPPPARLVLTLVDGATVIPAEESHSVQVDGAAGRFESLLSSIDDDAPVRSETFAQGGPVTVTVYDVEGYLPSEPIVVELSPGAAVEVAIPLRRRS